MAEKSLFDQAGAFWSRNTKLNAEGLVLLDKLIQRVASVDCDKDALTRFIARAGMDRSKVGRIVQAAFGKDLTFKADATKAAGGVMNHNWHGPDGYVLRNTYSHVAVAIEQKKAFNDAPLQKALAPAKVVSDATKAELLAAYKKRAEKWASDNGLTIGMLVAALQAKDTAVIEESVINGVKVYKIA